MAGPFVIYGLGWFYFAIMGKMALVLEYWRCINTYACSNKAKDNELCCLFLFSIKDSHQQNVVVFYLECYNESMVFIPAYGFLDQWSANYYNVPLAIVPSLDIHFLIVYHNTDLPSWMLVALISKQDEA